MSEKCKYVAIDGTTLTFGNDGKLFMGQGDLRAFMYSIFAPYGYISQIKNEDIVQKQVPIYIKGSPSEVKSIANEVFNIFEKDVRYKNEHPGSEAAGKFYIGDCYLKCFFIGSSPSDYLTHKRYLKKLMTLVTDSPEWIKEEQFTFCNSTVATSSKRYPYTYPYAYRQTASNDIFINGNTTPADFEIVLEGLEGRALSNPYCVIGENQYRFNITLAPSEKLKFNSLSKTVIKISASGIAENALYTRDKAYDIFKKIPTGQLNLSLPENSKATITLLVKRSEPEWN